MDVTLRHCIALLLLALLSVLLCACTRQAIFPDPPPRPESLHSRGPANSELTWVIDRLAASHPGQSGVYPVTSAHNALAVRIAAVRAARRSIDIQYFIFRRDESGMLLTHELIDAAERGVLVRFLLDDFTTGTADELLMALQQHPNIEIRLFNPFPHKSARPVEFFADFCRLHRRMHHKSFTVDGRVSFIGGRNLSNKYFGIDKEVVFGDMDLLTIGAVVPAISRQFDLYWNSRYSFPLYSVFTDRPTPATQQHLLAELQRNTHTLMASDYGRGLLQSPVIDALSRDHQLWYWGRVQLLSDPPQKVEAPATTRARFASGELLREIDRARAQLIIISPYFLPGDYYLQKIIAAATRGVEVYILTNSLASSDLSLMHGHYLRYRRPLLKAGVHLYEMSSQLTYKLDNWNGTSRSLLHAKVFVIDRERAYVGSFNLDHRSIKLNTELGAMIHSKRLAGEFSQNFTANVADNAYEVRLRDGKLEWLRADGKITSEEPDASLLQKIGAFFSSWLPIEHLL